MVGLHSNLPMQNTLLLMWFATKRQVTFDIQNESYFIVNEEETQVQILPIPRNYSVTLE
jgi:hypothetical protein